MRIALQFRRPQSDRTGKVKIPSAERGRDWRPVGIEIRDLEKVAAYLPVNMQTFIIPVVGDGLHHVQKLAELDEILTSPPSRLLVKLIGPGGLSPETALAYCDLLGALPSETQTAVISYADLAIAEFALFLSSGPLREMRPSAHVFLPPVAATITNPGTVLVADYDAPFESLAYRRCVTLISRHVVWEDVVGRHLTPEDLADLLIIASDRNDSVLALLTTEVEAAR